MYYGQIGGWWSNMGFWIDWCKN